MRVEGFRLSCDDSGARRQLAALRRAFRAEAVMCLSRCGEECLSVARRTHGYTDRTGNLSSSMGYVVARDGRVVDGGGFDATMPSAAGGPLRGRSLAELVARGCGRGYALVLVAGMEYASFVERGHTARNGRWVGGRSVLSGSKAAAPGILAPVMDKLRRKAEETFSRMGDGR